jgi:hypothetical protein
VLKLFRKTLKHRGHGEHRGRRDRIAAIALRHSKPFGAEFRKVTYGRNENFAGALKSLPNFQAGIPFGKLSTPSDCVRKDFLPDGIQLA